MIDDQKKELKKAWKSSFGYANQSYEVYQGTANRWKQLSNDQLNSSWTTKKDIEAHVALVL